MIDFEYIEANKETFRNSFLTAKPFCLLALDNFCIKEKAEELLMYYMEVPVKGGGYTIDVEHGKTNAFKAIIEVQQRLEAGLRAHNQRQTGY